MIRSPAQMTDDQIREEGAKLRALAVGRLSDHDLREMADEGGRFGSVARRELARRAAL